MFRRFVIGFGVCGLLLSGVGSVSAVVMYKVIDLGIAGYPQTMATAMNAQGDVVGYYVPSFPNYIERAFIHSEGVTRDLGTLFDAAKMRPLGINVSGQVVGWAYTRNLGYHGFLSSNGTITDLGKLPGDTSGIFEVKATDINDRGKIVGHSYINGTYHAFLHSNGVMADLGTPTGCSASIANAINESGQVVGYGSTTAGEYHAFLYSDGKMTSLGSLGGATSVATDINDSGQIVGVASTGSAGHAFLYSNGTMIDLGVLEGFGNTSRAEGINSSGQIVGYTQGTSLGARAFLYSNGTMHNLNDLIDPTSGWKLIFADAINDNGWIAGCGVAPNGEQHAILLTPVPEPSVLTLLGFGAIGLLVHIRLRQRRCNSK